MFWGGCFGLESFALLTSEVLVDYLLCFILTIMVKNRRYTYLMKVLIDSDYFDEDQVKLRHPLLYHMYVGRFQQPASASEKGKEV